MSIGINLPQSRAAIKTADRVDVQVLVDNVTDQLSTNPEAVLSEFDCLMRAGMTTWGGNTICCPHFGLSLVITAYADGRQHTLLFDGGPEGYAVVRNGELLGVRFGAIEAVILSHGHFDHAGGLPTALELIRARNHGREIPLYLHPGMFRSRGDKLPDGSVLVNKDIPSAVELTQAGAAIVCTAEAQLILDSCFYLSGEIPRVTPYEQGLPGHMRKTEDGASWEADPLIMDERFLAVRVRDKGIVVFTACSHAGVVNVLTHARNTFPDTPLFAVMGGLHLSGEGPEKIIPETVKGMAGFGLKMMAPGHCTGWRAVNALVNTFGESVVVPSAVGKLYSF